MATRVALLVYEPICGGLILVNVPDFDRYDRMTFAESWDPLDVPWHLYHFSVSTCVGRWSKPDLK